MSLRVTVRFVNGRDAYECPYLGGGILDDTTLAALVRIQWPTVEYFGSLVTLNDLVLRDTRRDPPAWSEIPPEDPIPLSAPRPRSFREINGRLNGRANKRARPSTRIRTDDPVPRRRSRSESTCSLAGAELPIAIPFAAFSDLPLGGDDDWPHELLAAWDLIRELTGRRRRRNPRERPARTARATGAGHTTTRSGSSAGPTSWTRSARFHAIASATTGSIRPRLRRFTG